MSRLLFSRSAILPTQAKHFQTRKHPTSILAKRVKSNQHIRPRAHHHLDPQAGSHQLRRLSQVVRLPTNVIPSHTPRNSPLTIYYSWSTEHPKIWLSVPIVREKIVKYSQFHVDDAFRSKMGPTLPFATFDGAAEMWAKSYDDLMAVSRSP